MRFCRRYVNFVMNHFAHSLSVLTVDVQSDDPIIEDAKDDDDDDIDEDEDDDALEEAQGEGN